MVEWPWTCLDVSTPMASIHRRPRSPNWHGAFRQGGKLVLRSTGTPDRALAGRIADDWEQLAKAADCGTLVESQFREVCAGIAKRAGILAPGIKPPAVGPFVDDWLESKLKGLAQGSAWSYRKAVVSPGRGHPTGGCPGVHLAPPKPKLRSEKHHALFAGHHGDLWAGRQ